MRQRFTGWLSLMTVFFMLALFCTSAQAALLDFGPPVPPVVNSTPPNLGHGFPAWFRDTNRVPLQLCVEEVPGCLFAAADRPNPSLPARFPDNLPDELFYYSATALIGDQLLFGGVEMNFTDNGDGTYGQVGFARVRIRIDSTVAGNYTVTTPWKQYFFTVDQATIDANAGRRVINATEDIGLGANGDFTGILNGSVGPFVYSQGAPFGTAPNRYLGDNTPRSVVGSTFTDPVTSLPANIFRIQGPVGFTTVSTNLFAVTGKLYTEVIPAPLTVDKAAYALDSTGMQVNVFATTDPVSNQTNTAAAFPLNFALTGAPSTLQLSGTGITTQLLTTNSAADGKFFSASGPAPGIVPATVTVTNIADTPDTVKNVPLVDEVVINAATYDPLTKSLAITASSSDKVNLPVLQAFMPGMTAPLPGGLNVTFPVIDGLKTYNIPPLNVTVKSSKGGSTTASVSTFVAPPPPPTTVPVITTATLANGFVGAIYSQTLAATGGTAPYTWAVTAGSTLPAGLTFSPAGVLSGTPNAAGAITFSLQVTDSQVPAVTTFKTFTVVVSAPVVPATGATLTPGVARANAGASVTFNAARTGGDAGPYEYRFFYRLPNTATWIQARAYSTTPTWIWNTAALGLPPATYGILVHTRHVGSTLGSEALRSMNFRLR